MSTNAWLESYGRPKNDLWNTWVLSLEKKTEGAMDDTSATGMGDIL